MVTRKQLKKIKKSLDPDTGQIDEVKIYIEHNKNKIERLEDGEMLTAAEYEKEEGADLDIFIKPV